MIMRTFDTPLVQSILSNTTLLRRSGLKSPTLLDPENQPDLFYLLATEGSEVMGLVVFHQQNYGCYQGHVNYLPKHWGKDLAKHTREAIGWMFSYAECRKIFAFIPAMYPEIKRHAMLAGMKEEGVLEDSYFVDGKVYHQTLMGITKP